MAGETAVVPLKGNNDALLQVPEALREEMAKLVLTSVQEALAQGVQQAVVECLAHCMTHMQQRTKDALKEESDVVAEPAEELQSLKATVARLTEELESSRNALSALQEKDKELMRATGEKEGLQAELQALQEKQQALQEELEDSRDGCKPAKVPPPKAEPPKALSLKDKFRKNIMTGLKTGELNKVCREADALDQSGGESKPQEEQARPSPTIPRVLPERSMAFGPSVTGRRATYNMQPAPAEVPPEMSKFAMERLTKQRDALSQENLVLAKDNLDIKASMQRAKSERDNVSAEVQELTAARDDARVALERVMAERDALSQELLALSAVNDSAKVAAKSEKDERQARGSNSTAATSTDSDGEPEKGEDEKAESTALTTKKKLSFKVGIVVDPETGEEEDEFGRQDTSFSIVGSRASLTERGRRRSWHPGDAAAAMRLWAAEQVAAAIARPDPVSESKAEEDADEANEETKDTAATQEQLQQAAELGLLLLQRNEVLEAEAEKANAEIEKLKKRNEFLINHVNELENKEGCEEGSSKSGSEEEGDSDGESDGDDSDSSNEPSRPAARKTTVKPQLMITRASIKPDPGGSGDMRRGTRRPSQITSNGAEPPRRRLSRAVTVDVGASDRPSLQRRPSKLNSNEDRGMSRSSSAMRAMDSMSAARMEAKSNEMSNMEERLHELDAEIMELRDEKTKTEKEKQQLEKLTKDQEHQLERLREQVQVLGESEAGNKTRLTTQAQELETSKRLLSEMDKRLQKQERAVLENGRNERALLLTGALEEMLCLMAESPGADLTSTAKQALEMVKEFPVLLTGDENILEKTRAAAVPSKAAPACFYERREQDDASACGASACDASECGASSCGSRRPSAAVEAVLNHMYIADSDASCSCSEAPHEDGHDLENMYESVLGSATADEDLVARRTSWHQVSQEVSGGREDINSPRVSFVDGSARDAFRLERHNRSRAGGNVDANGKAALLVVPAGGSRQRSQSGSPRGSRLDVRPVLERRLSLREDRPQRLPDLNPEC
eukprot:TRINITY_DN37652_c0_g1_i3.p1 TRINITY_DN37652_c0_g1~~TRINITY_DN37652_c0_g1_i3.p1  ORF type:complete len:1023 (-),score=298.26 TRINITY_DN37652_c0_g1_i3:93-3161(-)